MAKFFVLLIIALLAILSMQIPIGLAQGPDACEACKKRLCSNGCNGFDPCTMCISRNCSIECDDDAKTSKGVVVSPPSP